MFSVVDTGPGIAEATRSQLFLPYRPGANSDGTGLGLYISKGIVERHGGRMWHEATEGGGAAFYFALPAA